MIQHRARELQRQRAVAVSYPFARNRGVITPVVRRLSVADDSRALSAFRCPDTISLDLLTHAHTRSAARRLRVATSRHRTTKDLHAMGSCVDVCECVLARFGSWCSMPSLNVLAIVLALFYHRTMAMAASVLCLVFILLVYLCVCVDGGLYLCCLSVYRGV